MEGTTSADIKGGAGEDAFLNKKKDELAKLNEELAALKRGRGNRRAGRNAAAAAAKPSSSSAAEAAPPPPPPGRPPAAGVTKQNAQHGGDGSPPPPPPFPRLQARGGDERGAGAAASVEPYGDDDELLVAANGGIGRGREEEEEEDEEEDYHQEEDEEEKDEGEYDSDSAVDSLATTETAESTGVVDPRHQHPEHHRHLLEQAKGELSTSRSWRSNMKRRSYNSTLTGRRRGKGGGAGGAAAAAAHEVSSSDFLTEWKRKYAEAAAGATRPYQQKAKAKDGAGDRKSHMRFTTAATDLQRTPAAAARAAHSYSNHFTPYHVAGGGGGGSGGGGGGGGGRGGSGANGSSDGGRPRWVGRTRRNTYVGGKDAQGSLWLLSPTLHDEAAAAAEQVRRHQSKGPRGSPSSGGAGGHGSPLASSVSSAFPGGGGENKIAVMVPPRTLNPYLFLKQVDSRAKQQAVRENLANLERRRKLILAKDLARAREAKASEDAETAAAAQWLRERGASQWGEGGATPHDAAARRRGGGLGGGEGGGLLEDDDEGDGILTDDAFVGSLRPNLPKHREMSFHGNRNESGGSKGVMGWHDRQNDVDGSAGRSVKGKGGATAGRWCWRWEWCCWRATASRETEKRARVAPAYLLAWLAEEGERTTKTMGVYSRARLAAAAAAAAANLFFLLLFCSISNLLPLLPRVRV